MNLFSPLKSNGATSATDTAVPRNGAVQGVASRVAKAPCQKWPIKPLPPRVASGAAPLQSGVPDGLALPGVGDAGTTPLAGFSIEARVLGSETYRLDREAAFAPLDLALGWGRMTDDAVLSRLQLSQGGRWYRYRWQGDAPIPREEIARSSANMHMIPADDAVAAALDRIERGERVRIDGWLVEIDANDGWRWRSSLTRDDSGGGACELVYVCSITRE